MVPTGCWNYQGDHIVRYMTVYHYAVPLKLIKNNVECKLYLKIFYLLLERGEERERERETSMCERYEDRLPLARPQLGTWPTTQACALTRNRTGDLLACRLALNPLSLPSHGRV